MNKYEQTEEFQTTARRYRFASLEQVQTAIRRTSNVGALAALNQREQKLLGQARQTNKGKKNVARVENRSVEYVDGKGWLLTVPAHVLYGNDFPFGSPIYDGMIHIHAADCAHLKHYNVDPENYQELSSLKDAVLETYGPQAGSFFEESGYVPGTPEYEEAWRDYVGEFKVFGCIELPEEPTYED